MNHHNYIGVVGGRLRTSGICMVQIAGVHNGEGKTVRCGMPGTHYFRAKGSTRKVSMCEMHAKEQMLKRGWLPDPNDKAAAKLRMNALYGKARR